ncbi:MAG: hypothetical protein D6694_08925, partial [Gammaproteobacteria bacterium]
MVRALFSALILVVSINLYAAESQDVTVAKVQQVRKHTEETGFADANEKNDVLRILDETLTLLNREEYLSGEYKRLQQLLQTSEAELRKQLETHRSLLKGVSMTSAPQSELEQIEQTLEQARQEWQDKVLGLNAEVAEWSGGGRNLVERLNQVRQELEKLAALPPLPPMNAPLLRADDATILLKHARKQLLLTESKLLKLRLANADKLFKWAQLQKENAERQLDRIRAEQAQVANELRRRRELSAQSLSDSKTPSASAEIETEIASVLRKINEISAYRARIIEAYEKKNAAFQRLKQYMEAAPESAAITRMLRQWLQEVPEDMVPSGQLSKLLQETAERHLQLQLAMDDVPQSPEALEVQSRLAKNLSKLITEIRQAMEAEGRLVALSQQARDYANRALLWRRINDFTSVFSVEAWKAVSDALQNDILPNFVSHRIKLWQIAVGALLLLLQVLLILQHSTLQAKLSDYGRLARKIRTDRMGLTWKSLAASVLLALRWPGLFMLLGGILALAGGHETRALAMAVGMTGLTGFVLEFFRVLSIDDGVGHRHFRWSREMRKATRDIMKRYALSLSLAFGLVWFGRASIATTMLLPQILGSLMFNLVLWIASIHWLRTIAPNGLA